jgi:hypothetical protein
MTCGTYGRHMKKLLLAGMITAGALAVPFTGIASADQPERPGCFGQDRSAWIHDHSGAEWGAIASVRAGDNGSINAGYKATTCL